MAAINIPGIIAKYNLMTQYSQFDTVEVVCMVTCD